MKSVSNSRNRLPVVARDGLFVLLLIVGGGRVAAFRHWRRALADYSILFDVPAELDRIRARLTAFENVAYFPLGQGETADTLGLESSKELKALLGRLGSMNAGTGLGQVPSIGHLSALKLNKGDAFSRFRHNILDEVIVRTGGRPRAITVRVMGSTAGGTASGAGELIASSLVDLLSALEIPIDLDFDYVDATTYAGLGERLGRNSAATICELAAYCYTKGGKPYDRVSRNLDLLALPPFRHEKGIRDQFVALDEQALDGKEMKAFRHMIRPNHALDGPLGTIVYRQVDFFRTLDPETEVAIEVARQLLPFFETALNSAGILRELISSIYTNTDSTPLLRESIENLVQDLPALTDDDFLISIERPAESFICSTGAEAATGEKFVLERIGEDFLKEPSTLDEAVHRLSLLRTLARLVSDELNAVNQDVFEIEDQASKARLLVQKQLRIARRGGGLFGNQKKATQKLATLCYSLRSLFDQSVHQRAVQKALQSSLHEINRTEVLHSNHLQGIRNALEEFRPRGHSLPELQSFVVQDINDGFKELSPIASHSRAEQVAILCGQVVSVTVAGLARVLDVAEPRMELIADRIVNGPVVHIGPYVGSTRHGEGAELVYALPPLVPAARAALTHLLNLREPKAVIVFADYAAAGINVLRYRFFRPKTVRELFPGLLAHDLRAALKDELKPLFFPHGDERPAVLGVPEILG